MAIDGYKFSKPTGGGVGAMDAKDGADLQDLDLALVLDPDSDAARLYLLKEDSGATADGERIVEPLANAGQKRWIKKFFAQTNSIPVGSIVPFIGGYFANNSNGGFVNVLGNDAASVNSLVNGDGWYVCDGAEVNVPGSPMFDGTGRHIANITDDRFIMGHVSAGDIGGSNLSSHIHSIDIPAFLSGATTLSVSQMPSHGHELYFYNTTTSISDRMIQNSIGQEGTGALKSAAGHAVRNTGGGEAHTHSIDPPAGSTNSKTLDNRPKFLTAIYIQKVI